MLSLIKIEWLKIKKYPAFWWMLGIVALTYPGVNAMFYYGYLEATTGKEVTNNIAKMLLGNPFAFPEIVCIHRFAERRNRWGWTDCMTINGPSTQSPPIQYPAYECWKKPTPSFCFFTDSCEHECQGTVIDGFVCVRDSYSKSPDFYEGLPSSYGPVGPCTLDSMNNASIMNKRHLFAIGLPSFIKKN